MSAVVIERFAGPGGWSQGMRALGLAGVGLDLSPEACATAIAAGHARLCLDVARCDPRSFGPVWGGIDSPPCPGWSVAGKGGARRDAATVLAAVARCRDAIDVDEMIAALGATMEHPETLLAVEPLRWALAQRPAWLAWEQVREVLPLWQVSAEVLRRNGYTVETGVLAAESYGVPQTRRRAILVARSAEFTREHGVARLPTPTHSRYHSHDPQRLDAGVKPWVSMGEALGWTEPHAVVTGQNSRQAGGTTQRFWRSAEVPAPTLTGQARSWRLRSNYGTGGDPAARGLRTLDQPAPTITGKAGRNVWLDPAGEDAGRLTAEQASTLQTFPSGYPWHGGRVATFQQIGDAVPPLLARTIVAEVAAIDEPLR
jgi:DNA (cytosine-5)-methyltransferase 1